MSAAIIQKGYHYDLTGTERISVSIGAAFEEYTCGVTCLTDDCSIEMIRASQKSGGSHGMHICRLENRLCVSLACPYCFAIDVFPKIDRSLFLGHMKWNQNPNRNEMMFAVDLQEV